MHVERVQRSNQESRIKIFGGDDVPGVYLDRAVWLSIPHGGVEVLRARVIPDMKRANIVSDDNALTVIITRPLATWDAKLSFGKDYIDSAAVAPGMYVVSMWRHDDAMSLVMIEYEFNKFDSGVAVLNASVHGARLSIYDGFKGARDLEAWMARMGYDLRRELVIKY